MPLKVSLILAVLLMGIVAGNSQVKRPREWARLDLRKPTVYLSLSNAINQDGRDDDSSSLRLELHNNTKWIILCYLTPEKTSPNDYPVLYKVEMLDGSKAANRAVGDVFMQKSVAPGNSISFPVLRKDLQKGQSIYVEFNYQWEVRDHISPYSVEPNHRVYFAHADLPMSLRQRD